MRRLHASTRVPLRFGALHLDTHLARVTIGLAEARAKTQIEERRNEDAVMHHRTPLPSGPATFIIIKVTSIENCMVVRRSTMLLCTLTWQRSIPPSSLCTMLRQVASGLRRSAGSAWPSLSVAPVAVRSFSKGALLCAAPRGRLRVFTARRTL